MGKYISLGEYNKLYKYIWIYLSIRFVTLFIFERNFVFEQIHVDIIKLQYSPFISLQIEYLGFLFISSILKLKNTFIKKKRPDKSSLINQKTLIYNEVVDYGITLADYFLYVNIFLVIIAELFDNMIASFKSTIFNYSTFDMLFLELFNSRLYNTKIYKHHIYSLIFILSSCSLIKSISIIINFSYDTDDIKIFDGRKWLIPSAIISYLLLSISIGYLYSNEKYYLEKKYISITDYLFCYGLFGVILTSICAIISTFVPCGDNNLHELSKIICTFIDDNGIYYFDSYKLYFKNMAKDYLGLKILFIIIYSTLYYSSTYYCYVIYKRLSPIYHNCMYQLNFLVLDILVFINDLANNKIKGVDITLAILDILILIFYLLGSIVYLEFIELNFCNLNYYLRRKIKARADSEIRISLRLIDGEMDDESEKN